VTVNLIGKGGGAFLEGMARGKFCSAWTACLDRWER
jgi:hypothetical protein